MKVLEILVRNYNFVGRYIQTPNEEAFITFSVNNINEFFNLVFGFDKPPSFGEFEEEYQRMDSTLR